MTKHAADTRRVIVDTSVWIDHEKKPDPILIDLLQTDRVIMHWAVLGELAVGNIRNRDAYLKDLDLFPRLDDFDFNRVVAYIEKNRLFGKGLSLVDCILLKAAEDEGLQLYSRDKKLSPAPIS
ncbi:PIN domain-containing protein [Bdellovibrionota bacterium FG-2]